MLLAETKNLCEMDEDDKKPKCQERYYAYSGITLLLSSPTFKNFLQELSPNPGLLGLLGNLAHGQPIQVSM